MHYMEQGLQFTWEDTRVMNLYNYAIGCNTYAKEGSHAHKVWTDVLKLCKPHMYLSEVKDNLLFLANIRTMPYTRRKLYKRIVMNIEGHIEALEKKGI